MSDRTRDVGIAAHLVEGAHTWDCAEGHRNATWENPPPAPGDQRKCNQCWPPDPGTVPVPVTTVKAGLPLAQVREFLGASMAARVLAAGGVA